MKKRILALIIPIFLMVFLIANISAGIYFSQLETGYNHGDIIDVNLDISPLEQGPLKVNLICDGISALVFYNSNPTGTVNVQLPLTSLYIQDLTGSCYFSAEHKGSEYKSREFKISKKLDVGLSTDSFFAKPGEEVTISGTARRINGKGVNGNVVITIPLLNLLNQNAEPVSEETSEQSVEGNASEEAAVEQTEVIEPKNIGAWSFYGKVVEGDFSKSFFLNKDTPAGDYRIDILVYEEVSGERTGEGIAMASLKVFQVLTGIDIALSKQNYNPGEQFNFKPMLIDQTGNPINNEVTVIIRDLGLNRIYEQIIQSEETVVYDIPTNLSAGYYEVEASSENVSIVKKFYLNEKAIASFRLENGTLIVTNTGNIPYKKDIQVELNGKPFVKKLDLDLSEVQKFRLTGFNEEYSVKVSDGETEISQQGVVLTGRAVGVENVKEGGFSLLKTPIVWIFFIIVLAAGALFLFRNVLKKKSFAYPFSEKFKVRKLKTVELNSAGKPAEAEKKKDEKKQEIPVKSATPRQAEQVLVLKGEKNRAAVIALKIKNKIGKIEKQSLERAIGHVYQKRGAVYEQGDYIFIVFSPLMTKSFKNEVEAVKIAEKILIILKEHNQKFRDKIQFGIGVNSGEIINKIENKKLKFTALGNLIIIAKRLAESSDEQILVSKETYEKGISEIKAEKRKIAGGEVYEVRRVIDHEKNQEFIKGFLDRMKKEGKK